MIYERFFKHLETCDGCTGLRNIHRCAYAAVCAHVEKLTKEGEVESAQDLIASSSNSLFKSSTEASPRTGNATRTIGTDTAKRQPWEISSKN